MNRYIQRQMIVWTLVLVAVLGVAVAFTVLQPPAGDVSRASGPGRLPASLAQDPPPEPIGPVNKGAGTADLDLDCDPAFNTTVHGKIRQVRLTGSYCEKGAKRMILSSVVTNATNGFIGTVFYPQKGGYTTDYISLAEGENTIRFEHDFDDGSSEKRDVKISRAPAAKD